MQNIIFPVVKGLSRAHYKIFVNNLDEVNKRKCRNCESRTEYVNI